MGNESEVLATSLPNVSCKTGISLRILIASGHYPLREHNVPQYKINHCGESWLHSLDEDLETDRD